VSRWVKDWRNLCNPSLHDRPEDVIAWLRRNGYAETGGAPTALALRRGLARRRASGFYWNLIRFVHLRRSSRRAQKSAE
jgi:hypothetical protein